jgi:phenylalanyl-tRNA synthetase beta chain
VTPPVHRLDVREIADVVEEVARRIGYDRIPGRVRAAASGGTPSTIVRSLALTGRERLLGLGFWEAAQSGLVPRALWDRLAGSGAERPAEVSNPLSLTGECLNPSLLVNLLVCLSGNVRRGNLNVRLFESARVFHRGKAGWKRRTIWHGSPPVRTAPTIGGFIPDLWKCGTREGGRNRF